MFAGILESCLENWTVCLRCGRSVQSWPDRFREVVTDKDTKFLGFVLQVYLSKSAVIALFASVMMKLVFRCWEHSLCLFNGIHISTMASWRTLAARYSVLWNWDQAIVGSLRVLERVLHGILKLSDSLESFPDSPWDHGPALTGHQSSCLKISALFLLFKSCRDAFAALIMTCWALTQSLCFSLSWPTTQQLLPRQPSRAGVWSQITDAERAWKHHGGSG